MDISNASTWTRCTGRSSSCPVSLPMRKAPAGTALNDIALAAVLADEPIGETRREGVEDGQPAGDRLRVQLGSGTLDAPHDRARHIVNALLGAESADLVPEVARHRVDELRRGGDWVDAGDVNRCADEFRPQRFGKSRLRRLRRRVGAHEGDPP